MNALAQKPRSAPARDDLKRRLLEAESHERAIAEAQAALARIDREADGAAAQHCADCEPLQAELSQIERESVDALLTQQPADPARDERRRQLLATLEDRNGALAETVRRIDDRRELLKSRLTELVAARGDTADSIRRQLVSTASEATCDALFVQERLAESLHAMSRDAGRIALENERGAVELRRREEGGLLASEYQAKSRRYRAIAQAFGAMAATAMNEAARLRQVAIDE